MSIPNEFICSITGQVMLNPVICADGHSYEESGIQEWFKRSDISPKTGLQLRTKEVIPNFALRNAIRDYADNYKHSMNAMDIQEIKEELQNQPQPHPINNKSVSSFIGISGKQYSKIESKSNERLPVHLICAVDVSGSMESSCTLGSEDNGFSRLDLVKHSLRTIAASMSYADIITLIKFSSTASVVYTGGKTQTLLTTIQNLQTDGATNVWDALKLCLETALTSNHTPSVMLLTDGVPFGHLDTRSILKIYNETPKYHSIPITAVGYGYELDLTLMKTLAVKSKGRFLYIPDISMIGTVIVHYLANIFSTDSSYLKLGHFILKEYDGPVDAQLDHDQETSYASVLLKFTQFINLVDTDADLPISIDLCKRAIVEFKNHPDLLNEITSYDLHKGQIIKALDSDAYHKWGKFYLAMLANAHNNQECYNFKDLSIQRYGGVIFRDLVNTIDKIYNTLPAPTPSVSGHNSVHVTNLLHLNQASNGCFTGNALVSVSGFSEPERVDSIKKGYYVNTGMKDLNGSNKYAKVLCIVKQYVSEQKMYDMDGFYITPWHPIYDTVCDTWAFPAALYPYQNLKSVKNNFVYNLVLEDTHQVLLNNTIAITLAHGNYDNPVLNHAYFGTQAIIEDLSKLNGWDKGIVEIKGFVRSSSSGLVSGILL